MRHWGETMAHAARAAAHAVHKWTPSFLSNPLSERLGAAVYVKMDALQPSGSFKLRGLGEAVANAAAHGVCHTCLYLNVFNAFGHCLQA